MGAEYNAEILSFNKKKKISILNLQQCTTYGESHSLHASRLTKHGERELPCDLSGITGGDTGVVASVSGGEGRQAQGVGTTAGQQRQRHVVPQPHHLGTQSEGGMGDIHITI